MILCNNPENTSLRDPQKSSVSLCQPSMNHQTPLGYIGIKKKLENNDEEEHTAIIWSYDNAII